LVGFLEKRRTFDKLCIKYKIYLSRTVRKIA